MNAETTTVVQNQLQDQHQGQQPMEANKPSETKPSTTMIVRMKRKANEDPLEKLIIEGELTQKRQKPNPLFGINFLEKMLNDLQIQNKNEEKEKQTDQQQKESDLFQKDTQADAVEKKQYVLKLVDNNEAVKQIKEAKLLQAENTRRKARNKQLQASRHHRFLEMTVDSTSKEVKVEKTKLNENEDDEEEYAYYEVEEREKTEGQEERFQNIGSLLQQESENILKVQSGFIHLIQTHNPELFDGEFDPYRKEDFSDQDSQDSNRESADQNDYPDEEEEYDDDEKDMEFDQEGEDYDNYDEDCEYRKKKPKSTKKKNNMFKDSLHGIYLGKQSSDDNSMNEENAHDEDDDGDDYEDDFNKKYNNFYHKRYEDDFGEDDYVD